MNPFNTFSPERAKKLSQHMHDTLLVLQSPLFKSSSIDKQCEYIMDAAQKLNTVVVDVADYAVPTKRKFWNDLGYVLIAVSALTVMWVSGDDRYSLLDFPLLVKSFVTFSAVVVWWMWSGYHRMKLMWSIIRNTYKFKKSVKTVSDVFKSCVCICTQKYNLSECLKLQTRVDTFMDSDVFNKQEYDNLESIELQSQYVVGKLDDYFETNEEAAATQIEYDRIHKIWKDTEESISDLDANIKRL